MSKIDKPRADRILEQILEISEERYGPRIADFKIRGVRFEQGIDVPQTRIENNEVTVLIDRRNKTECDRLCYQLAHEAIHLLSPVSRAQVSVLEEGLATHFAAIFMRTNFIVVSRCPKSKTSWDHSGDEKFERARALYRELEGIDVRAVRKLRETQRVISSFATESILSLFPELSPRTAELLSKRFSEWNPT